MPKKLSSDTVMALTMSCWSTLSMVGDSSMSSNASDKLSVHSLDVQI